MTTSTPPAGGELFDTIGSFGRWQKIVFAIFFYTNAVGIWQNFAMTFLTPNIPFQCVVDGNLSYNESQFVATPNADQCTVNVWSNTSDWNETVACKNWDYERTDTLISQWDLVCDNEWLISFAKSVYMIGFMASVFIFGQVSDWIGRFPTIVICFLITIVSLILSLFSTSVTAFLIFRFFQAFGRTGVTTTGYVLLMESVGPEVRMFVGITIQLGWCLGMVLLGLIGYIFKNSFWLQVVIAVPLLPLFLTYKFIPESPRWLIMHNKLDRLKKLIVSAAKRNGKELKEDPNEILKSIVKVKEENRGTILDLFRTPRMRGKTFNMMYLWIVNAFVYYALTFNTNDLSGDPNINFLLSGILEFPSYALLYFSIRKWGNRIPLVALMIVGGLACVALVPVPTEMVWLSTTLAMSGKFCVTASFGLLYLYTSELFPTVVRSAALGSCSTVARIGSIVAPFSRELGKATHPAVPNVLYCVLAVTSGLFALWLPETSNKKLPDSLQEGEEECKN